MSVQLGMYKCFFFFFGGGGLNDKTLFSLYPVFFFLLFFFLFLLLLFNYVQFNELFAFHYFLIKTFFAANKNVIKSVKLH